MKINNFILLICGKSGSGKTTLADKLSEMYGWTQVPSYTDRPKRHDGETGHVFVSPAEFDTIKDDEMVAFTDFCGQRYCGTKAQVRDHEIYVIDPKGIKQFNERYDGDKEVISIYLDLPENVLRERMSKRGDKPEEVEERIAHDREAFSAEKISGIDIDYIFSYSLMQDTMNDVEEFAKDIHKLVMFTVGIDENSSKEGYEKGKIFQTSVRCPKCGKLMMVSDIPEYAYQCFDCDEDFYAVECHETLSSYVSGKFWEITLSGFEAGIDAGWYEENRSRLDMICKRYGITFLGLDSTEEQTLVYFGWNEAQTSETIQRFTSEIMRLLPEKKEQVA